MRAVSERSSSACRAFEKELRVADGLLIELRCGQFLHARAQAAMNVVLQAGARMIAGEIDLAAGQQKAAMNQFDDAVGEIARESRGRSRRSRPCADGA